MPSGSRRSTSLANACSSVPEQLLVKGGPSAKSPALSRLVCGTGACHAGIGAKRCCSPVQPQQAWSQTEQHCTQTWMDSSSVASSWRMWRRPSWDDASF